MNQPIENDQSRSHGPSALQTKIPVADGEFFILYAEDFSDLPSQNVNRELTHAATRYRNETRRDWQTFLETSAISGMIGSAAWASAANGYRALRTYWQKRGIGRPRANAATVIELVKQACDTTLGKTPGRLDVTEVKQVADGSWRVDFTVDAANFTVRVDEYGDLLHWIRHEGS